MRFRQHYSSSSGNLYTLTARDGKCLMIECGVPWRKLQESLRYDLSGIVGCVLTHNHLDHSKAVAAVMVAGIDVYASAGTFEAVGVNGDRRAKRIPERTLTEVGGFHVIAYPAHHDAEEPLLFIVGYDGKYMLFATDTSHLTQRFDMPFKIIALECAYDKNILQKRVDTGDINESLAKRLLSSHMEKRNCISYLAEYCDLSQCEEIHLLHMSGDNIDKEQARMEIEKQFFIETVVV
jgi:phosphoribosyl 1,2-cyclic phosphodiesterase